MHKHLTAGLLLALGLASTTPALAQTDGTAASAAPAPAAKLNFTLDTPIEKIAANPRGKAVIEKIFPDLLKHEAYPQFKALSLKGLAQVAGGAITADQLKQADAGLKKLDE